MEGTDKKKKAKKEKKVRLFIQKRVVFGGSFLFYEGY